MTRFVTDGHTDRNTDRQTDRKTDRQTDRRTYQANEAPSRSLKIQINKSGGSENPRGGSFGLRKIPKMEGICIAAPKDTKVN